MGFFQEFKEFAMRGNVMDMAIGVVLGGAFGKIVTSAVNDLIMPITGALTGGQDFSDKVVTFGEGDTAAKLAYGNFMQTVIDFVIIAFFIFVVIKIMNSMQKKEEAAPAAPPKEEVLLTEIRDLLAKK